MVFVEGVQVLDLLLRDGLALRHRHFADLILVRLAGALLGLDGVLEQDAGGRGFQFDVERAVAVGLPDDARQRADRVLVHVDRLPRPRVTDRRDDGRSPGKVGEVSSRAPRRMMAC